MSAGDCRVCLGFTHPLDVHGTGCPNAPVSAGDRDTLALAELLADHALLFLDEWADKCRCEEWIAESEDNRVDIKNHRAHVADVIASSDWLREQRTEAWKAGHGWCDDGIDGMCDHEPFTPNPYLED